MWLQCGIMQLLISLTDFLAVKKCAFLTMHGGSALMFCHEPNFDIYWKSVWQSFVKQMVYGISGFLYAIIISLSRAMRKRVLCHMRTTKPQISLRVHAVWSGLCCSLPRFCSFCNQCFKPHARFCGWAGQFESDLVGNSRRHVLSCRG